MRISMEAVVRVLVISTNNTSVNGFIVLKEKYSIGNIHKPTIFGVCLPFFK